MDSIFAELAAVSYGSEHKSGPLIHSGPGLAIPRRDLEAQINESKASNDSLEKVVVFLLGNS